MKQNVIKIEYRKYKRNAKGYAVKCENKINAKNSPRILRNLKIQKTFYIIKNLKGTLLSTAVFPKFLTNFFFFFSKISDLSKNIE